MWNKIKNILMVLGFIFLFLCFYGEDEETIDKPLIGTSGDKSQTWAIYWYLCGSDLESDGGAASQDLEEMLSVKLPDNIKIIIETGGATYWENEKVNPDKIQRFEYSSKGLKLIEEKRQSNMGNYKTLKSFLEFASKNYPADKKMMIFWNHGGGSVAGAAFDENYDNDSLKLSEFHRAFSEVFDLKNGNTPFDVIGFDACLMASIDTAYTFKDISRYLVASEEWEPGGGWDYEAFLNKLVMDPGMDGARLSQHISDTYMDSVGWFFEDDATMSVVDLKKAKPLFKAYEELGVEALLYALDNPYFFSEFGRMASITENYGGNTRDQGYTNMVDLGDLATNCDDILPKNAKKIVDLLKECVIYQVKGIYHEDSSGLSCYYSYNGDFEDFNNYLDEGFSTSFKYLFGYEFVGELPYEGMQYLNSLGYKHKHLPHVPNIVEDGKEDYPIDFDKDNNITIKFDKDTASMLKTIYFDLAYVDEHNDEIIMLGQDNDLTGDFESGEFKDNFRGVWGSIDDHLVYMEVSFEGDNYTSYSVPILLNGEQYNLKVVYNYDKSEYKILGARKGLEDNGMADKNLIKLKKGDKITPIHYSISLSGNDDIKTIKKETFTIDDNPKFSEKELKDGNYLLMFEFVDVKNNIGYSQMAEFALKGDEVFMEILD